jgi:malate dehydrogenase (oxaloacetate-decarboxylating)
MMYHLKWNSLDLKYDWTAPVSCIMRSPPVQVSPDENVSAVADLMTSNDIGSVIVTVAGEPLGIVTEKDIVDRIVREGRNPKKVTVRKIMSSPVLSIENDRKVADALILMREKKIRRLPVTEGGRLVGIVTERRLLTLLSIPRKWSTRRKRK